MQKFKIISLLISLLVSLVWTSIVNAEVFVLSTGSNKSLDRSVKPLDFASSDAQIFAKTMAEVGAVSAKNIKITSNPSLKEFEASLDSIATTASSKQDQDISKFVFFFSGHADERGLHFRDGFFSKNSLDRFLARLKTKTKVLIIDTCFAGILSSKGIRPTEGFGSPKLNFDEPSGSIFLTASSSSEFAFESRKLRGGLFTSNIVAGLLGGADSNTDGVVTATELYEFAFRETQMSSRLMPVPTTQNPEFVANLSGRGSVALSFPAKSRGQLQMTPNLKGSLKFYASKGIATFEHVKNYGSADVINLPAGDYRVELTDGTRKGSGDLRIPSKAVALLTEDDIDWSSPVNTSLEIKSKGFQESPISQKIISASIGSHVLGNTLDAQIALQSGKVSSWLRPQLAIEYSKKLKPSEKGPSEEEYDTYYNHDKFVSGYGAMFGLMIPMLTTENIKSALCFVPSVGIKKVHFSKQITNTSQDVIAAKAELMTTVFNERLQFAVGIERLFSEGKSDIDTQVGRQILMRVGTGFFAF